MHPVREMQMTVPEGKPDCGSIRLPRMGAAEIEGMPRQSGPAGRNFILLKLKN
jgi:hypothetical protein